LAARRALVQAAALALCFGLLAASWLLVRPLALLFIAVVLAEAVSPAVDWLSRGLPRTLAALLVYLIVALAVGGIGWVVIPPLVHEAQKVFATAPDVVQRAQQLANRWDTLPNDQALSAVQSWLSDTATRLISLPLAIVSSTFEILVVVIMSIYWLLAGPAIQQFVLSLLPTSQREQGAAVLDEMGRTTGGYVRAVVLDALVVGALVYVGLLLIGIDYPLVLALVAVLGELVPMLGPFIAAVPALAVALLHSPTQALIVLAFYVAVQQLEGHLLTPNIMRQQTDMPPVLVLFALLAGGAAGSILGALVAIPLAGALRVIVLRVAAPALRRWSGAT
jgi:predicted PurR-regulated permease PerM